eukprot:354024-Chlamydomonas_euryale.AAC.1
MSHAQHAHQRAGRAGGNTRRATLPQPPRPPRPPRPLPPPPKRAQPLAWVSAKERELTAGAPSPWKPLRLQRSLPRTCSGQPPGPPSPQRHARHRRHLAANGPAFPGVATRLYPYLHPHLHPHVTCQRPAVADGVVAAGVAAALVAAALCTATALPSADVLASWVAPIQRGRRQCRTQAVEV